MAFAYTQSFRLLLYGVVTLIGILVGLEIPLLMRILKERFEFRDLVAHVLTFDYLGALGASLLFPLVLVPKMGMVRSALLFGIVNAAVALWTTFSVQGPDTRSGGFARRFGPVAVCTRRGHDFRGTDFSERRQSALRR